MQKNVKDLLLGNVPFKRLFEVSCSAGNQSNQSQVAVTLTQLAVQLFQG